MMFAEKIYEVGKAPGRIAKENLLKKYSGDEMFKKVLHYIMNPYIRTGISRRKIVKEVGNIRLAGPVSFEQAMEYFRVHPTGTDRDIAFAQIFIASHKKEMHDLAVALVTKDLTIGVTATTLNKVYGANFIPKLGIMLGTNFQDVKDPKGPWIATEKLDGHRRILVKENGICSFYSRSGIPDIELDIFMEEAAQLPDNSVYDGECLAIGNFKNSLELRQATNSIMNSSGPKKGITYNVFDIVDVNEFKTNTCTKHALYRKFMLCGIFNDPSMAKMAPPEGITRFVKDASFSLIKNVPILGIPHTIEEAIDYAIPIWDRGFEGVMLNKIDSMYEIKRSKDLLKVKLVESLDLPVLDMMEGTGKYKGMLGSLVVNYKGCSVGVGSGLTDAQRKLWWDSPELIIGKTIEIDTFGETKNKEGGLSLNAPIFKGVRYDK
jgi:DNA ligase 1